jgi:hypothetical protein
MRAGLIPDRWPRAVAILRFKSSRGVCQAGIDVISLTVKGRPIICGNAHEME